MYRRGFVAVRQTAGSSLSEADLKTTVFEPVSELFAA